LTVLHRVVLRGAEIRGIGRDRAARGATESEPAVTSKHGEYSDVRVPVRRFPVDPSSRIPTPVVAWIVFWSMTWSWLAPEQQARMPTWPSMLFRAIVVLEDWSSSIPIPGVPSA
jgi:hypothetical protein